MKVKWLAQGHCSPSKQWRDRVHPGSFCPSANTGHHAAAVAFLWAQPGVHKPAKSPGSPWWPSLLPSPWVLVLAGDAGGGGIPPAWQWGRRPGHPTLEGLPHSLLDGASLVVDTMLLVALQHLCL